MTGKKSFLILLIAFIALGFSSRSSFCAEKRHVFGFTNVSKAMMLHPLMGKFKVKEGRFVPEVLQKRTGADVEKARKQLEDKRKLLTTKRKKLEQKLAKADKKFSKSLSDLNVQFNAKRKLSSPDKGSDQYNIEKSRLESSYWVQRKELQQQVSSLKDELAKISEENNLMHLTSPDETMQVFRIMLDDIYEAIDVVSKHYKVDIVLNSSFTVERTAVNPSFTPTNPMGEFFNKEFKRDASEVLYKHGKNGEAPLFMTLDYWCACQRWTFRQVVDSRLDKMILKGGLDMTPAVIDFVYQKHKVPAGHRDIVQEFLKKQSN